MTITIELPPDIEANLVAEAQKKGIPIGELIKAHLLESIAPALKGVPIGPEEREKALEALFDSLTAPTGIQEGAFHRDNWYR